MKLSHYYPSSVRSSKNLVVASAARNGKSRSRLNSRLADGRKSKLPNSTSASDEIVPIVSFEGRRVEEGNDDRDDIDDTQADDDSSSSPRIYFVSVSNDLSSSIIDETEKRPKTRMKVLEKAMDVPYFWH